MASSGTGLSGHHSGSNSGSSVPGSASGTGHLLRGTEGFARSRDARSSLEPTVPTIGGVGSEEFRDLLLRKLAAEQKSTTSPALSHASSQERDVLKSAVEAEEELQKHAELRDHSRSRSSGKSAKSGAASASESGRVSSGNRISMSPFDEARHSHTLSKHSSQSQIVSLSGVGSQTLQSLHDEARFGDNSASSDTNAMGLREVSSSAMGCSSGVPGGTAIPSSSASGTISGTGTGSRSCSRTSAAHQLLSQLSEAAVAGHSLSDNVFLVQNALNEFSKDAGQEIASLKRKLELSKRKERELYEEQASLRDCMTAKEDSHVKDSLNLKEQVEMAKAKFDDIEEKRGALEDRMQGQEAATEMRAKQVRQRYKEEQRAADKKHSVEKSQMKAQRVSLQRQLHTAKLSEVHGEENRTQQMQKLEENFAAAAALHTTQMSNMNLQLSRDRASQGDLQSPPTSSATLAQARTPGDGRKSKAGADVKVGTQVQIMEQAHARFELQQRTMVDELSELRLEMLGMERGRMSEVGDLQRLLEMANARLWQQEGTSAGGGKIRRPAGNLPAIEEDVMSVDGDATASAYATSVGGDMIASDSGSEEMETETTDATREATAPDEKTQVDALKGELAVFRESQDCLAVTSAVQIAEQNSKIERLLDKLISMKNVEAHAKDEAKTLQIAFNELSEKSSEAKGFAQEMQQLKEMLMFEQTHGLNLQAENFQLREESGITIVEHQEVVMSLTHQLAIAIEARKFAEARAEDLRRALISTEAAHRQKIAEIRQQVMAERVSGSASPQALDEKDELQQRCIGLVEERNMLLNKIECTEVQQRVIEEHITRQFQVDLHTYQAAHRQEIQEMQDRFERDMAEARSRLQAALKAQAHAEAIARSATETSAKALQAALAQEGAKAQRTSVFDFVRQLRCPSRSSSSEAFREGSASTESMMKAHRMGTEETTAYGQDLLWEVLNAVPHASVLLCTKPPKMEILSASKNAQAALGLASGSTRTLTALLRNPARASWIKKSIMAHQDIADEGWEGVPGLLIRNLGTEEFHGEGTAGFASPVITVHLPPDATRGHDSALVVLLEFQSARSREQRDVAKVQRPAVFSGTHSDVSIHPSDSVSQVAANMRR